MSSEEDEGKVWNIYITNCEEFECHGLTKADLHEMLEDEWNREFNGIIIGRDRDCRGRLIVFFKGKSAYVAYDDFDDPRWLCAFDLEACKSEDRDELVRLTPDDTQEYSFRRRSVIPKERALRIVERYLTSGDLQGLYADTKDGLPPEISKLCN